MLNMKSSASHELVSSIF